MTLAQLLAALDAKAQAPKRAPTAPKAKTPKAPKVQAPKAQAPKVQTPKAQARKAGPTSSEVTNFLRTLTTQVGGQVESVRLATLEDALRYETRPAIASEIRASWRDAWFVTPMRRQRLDHYVGRNYRPGEGDDPEGWDSEGWEEEYAGPLEREVQAKLDARFGKGLFSVSIGEKGHIDVERM